MRAALIVSLLLAGPAYAEDPKGPHAEGDYGGVNPGEKPPTTPKKQKRPPKGTLSWVGFEAKNGSGEVFLQSPGPFEVAQRVENGTLVVNLTGVSRLGQNTWRPIDTQFFDSPVAKVVARKKAKGKGLELRITFKKGVSAKEATTRSATEPDGYHYQYLTFAGVPSTESTVNDPEGK